MKKQTRGMGFLFQPRYCDKKTGVEKTAATWWISYSDHGKRHKENARHHEPEPLRASS